MTPGTRHDCSHAPLCTHDVLFWGRGNGKGNGSTPPLFQRLPSAASSTAFEHSRCSVRAPVHRSRDARPVTISKYRNSGMIHLDVASNYQPSVQPNAYLLANTRETQEGCDIAKMTARCALYMSALKVNPKEEVVGGRGWYHSKERC